MVSTRSLVSSIVGGIASAVGIVLMFKPPKNGCKSSCGGYAHLDNPLVGAILAALGIVVVILGLLSLRRQAIPDRAEQ